MDRIIGEQTRPLVQIAFPSGPDYDRSQSHHFPGAGALDQQTRHQAANPAEAVKHHILRFGNRALLITYEIRQLLSHKAIDIFGALTR